MLSKTSARVCSGLRKTSQPLGANPIIYLSFGTPSQVKKHLKEEGCDIWDSFGA